jgi:hypothetical protein
MLSVLKSYKIVIQTKNLLNLGQKSQIASLE